MCTHKNGIATYLNYIMEITKKLKNTYEKKYDSKPLIAFRGESLDYGKTKLMPSIFRNPKYLMKEKYLFELICDFELIEYQKRNIDKAIEAQHYVAISRMLDITFNAAVALYFACSENAKGDGFIYVFCFPEYYSPHSNFVENFYSDILNSNVMQTYSKNFKVFSHSYSNERIKAQSGGFIFFPGDTFSPINEIYYKKIQISAVDKNDIKEELELLFHINTARLFPEKDKIAAAIKKKFYEDNYINENLSLQTEINSSFKRISYELEAYSKDKVRALRYLRKEKSDLLIFLDNYNHKISAQINKKDCIEEEILTLKKHINDKFDFYMKML